MADLVTVEGRLAVESLLDSSLFRTRQVFLQQGRHAELLETCRSRGIPVSELSPDALSAEAGYEFHRGVLAEAERPEERLPPPEFLETARRLVVPVGLADPGNLGTVVRSSAAFGADGILLPRGKGADVYSRKAIRASATAIFRIPVFTLDDPLRRLEPLREAGFVSFAATPDPGATPLVEVRPGRKNIVFLGAESDGLSAELIRACDETIRIPMRSGMDSLNVAATAAVILWELFGKGEA